MKKLSLFLLPVIGLSVLLAATGCKKAEVVTQSYGSPEAKVGDATTCPVIGTKFTVKEDTKYAKVDGTKYYVCCPACIDKIEKEPEKYLKD